MFCPKCGKPVKDDDNFCRYCGNDLSYEDIKPENEFIENHNEDIIPVNDNDEEIVLYEVQKHWIEMVVPVFLIPLFFLYFWNIFLNTHSFFSWIVMIAILGFIIYPVARFKSDKMVITNKFVHIKTGVLNPDESDIPINDINNIEITQTSMGRIFNYGNVSYCSFNEKTDYGNIKYPEDLQYIIDNTADFINESMSNS